MFYYWLLDLCATCARDAGDFRPYTQLQELLASMECRTAVSLYALRLLAEGYVMTK